MLPAFPMVKNDQSIAAIRVAAISLLANALKRVGPVKWDEPLEEKLVRWNLLYGGQTYDDLRLNLIVVGEPGSGKTALLKGIANLNPGRVAFRQSAPHKDQMIGGTEKWQEGGKWKYEVFPGELSSDIYIMDEILSVYLVDSADNKGIRELLRTALSRIGTNKVTKPLTKVPEAYHPSYYPEATMVQGFQPVVVPLSLISEGDIRRAQIITVEFSLESKETTNRFGSDEPPSASAAPAPVDPSTYKQAKDYLTYLRSRPYKIWIPTSTSAYVKDCMKTLRDYVLQQGPKANYYFKTAYFDIESQLYRYAVVFAVIRDAERAVIDVQRPDVANAFRYFSLSFAESITWINKYVRGDQLPSQPLKENDMLKTADVLKWLEGKGDTAVCDVKNYFISRGWFTTLAGTKRFYQQLLELGYIRSVKRGGKWFVMVGPSGIDYLKEVRKAETGAWFE